MISPALTQSSPWDFCIVASLSDSRFDDRHSEAASSAMSDVGHLDHHLPDRGLVPTSRRRVRQRP
jgi:hypothetical protein